MKQIMLAGLALVGLAFILPDIIGFVRMAVVIIGACGNTNTCFEGLLGG